MKFTAEEIEYMESLFKVYDPFMKTDAVEQELKFLLDDLFMLNERISEKKEKLKRMRDRDTMVTSIRAKLQENS